MKSLPFWPNSGGAAGILRPCLCLALSLWAEEEPGLSPATSASPGLLKVSLCLEQDRLLLGADPFPAQIFLQALLWLALVFLVLSLHCHPESAKVYISVHITGNYHLAPSASRLQPVVAWLSSPFCGEGRLAVLVQKQISPFPGYVRICYQCNYFSIKHVLCSRNLVVILNGTWDVLVLDGAA